MFMFVNYHNNARSCKYVCRGCYQCSKYAFFKFIWYAVCSFFNGPLGSMKLIINFLLNQIKSTVFILSGDWTCYKSEYYTTRPLRPSNLIFVSGKKGCLFCNPFHSCLHNSSIGNWTPTPKISERPRKYSREILFFLIYMRDLGSLIELRPSNWFQKYY